MLTGIHTDEVLALLQLIKRNLTRYFSNEEVVTLFAILFCITLCLFFFSSALIPFIVSIVLAYLLNGIVNKLRHYMPHLLASLLVFLGFILLCLSMIFLLLPIILEQIIAFAKEFPHFIEQLQSIFLRLQTSYPTLLHEEIIQQWSTSMRDTVSLLSQWLLVNAQTLFSNLIVLSIYLVLIPTLVFFFLRDTDYFVQAVSQYLPKKRTFISHIWQEVDQQIMNYCRGKLIEIFVVGTVSFSYFFWINLHYSLLLSILVGLSVLIPFVGAAVVTVPIAIVAFLQFGWSNELLWLAIVYATIQAVDGNILVPVLFSEVIDLHPVFIILSVLVFGSLWGVWGVFFAIPLATLVKATLSAWPKTFKKA